MTERPLTDQQVARFHQDGYLFFEDFLDEEETALLQQACRADSLMQRHAMDVRDAAGRRTNLSLWNHHPRYTPLVKVPDSAIKETGAKPTPATQRFLQQGEDDTSRRLEVEAGQS